MEADRAAGSSTCMYAFTSQDPFSSMHLYTNIYHQGAATCHAVCSLEKAFPCAGLQLLAP